MVGTSVAPSDVIVAEFLPEISCWERWFEVLATVTTGVVFVAKVLRPPGVFLIACTTLWASWFIFQRGRHGSKIFFVWGLRIDQPNLKYSFILPSIFALLAIVGIAIAAVVQEHRMQFDNWHLWLVLVLYPFWGLLQQVLVFSFLVRHLNWWYTGSEDKNIINMSWTTGKGCWRSQRCLLFCVALCIFIPPFAFTLLHSPDGWFMAFAGVMGFFWAISYLVYRNVLPLGLYHGLLLALFYFWFVGRDPLNTLF